MDVHAMDTLSLDLCGCGIVSKSNELKTRERKASFSFREIQLFTSLSNFTLRPIQKERRRRLLTWKKREELVKDKSLKKVSISLALLITHTYNLRSSVHFYTTSCHVNCSHSQPSFYSGTEKTSRSIYYIKAISNIFPFLHT